MANEKQAFEEEALDEAMEALSDIFDDTTFTQQASADAWAYIAEQCRNRQRTIEQEIEEADETEDEEDEANA